MPKSTNEQMSEEESEKQICNTCEQEIPERCPYCRQFVYDDSDSDDDECDECGQAMPEEEVEEYDVIKRRHGVLQPMCNLCRRPLEKCPECKEEFDGYLDSRGRRHYGADPDDDDDTDEEEEEDDDEENESKEGDQKGKGSQGRRYYNF